MFTVQVIPNDFPEIFTTNEVTVFLISENPMATHTAAREALEEWADENGYGAERINGTPSRLKEGTFVGSIPWKDEA